MNKIKKVSTYMVRGFNILLMVLPLILGLQWLFLSLQETHFFQVINVFGLFEKELMTPEGCVSLHHVKWTAALKLLGFCAELMSLLPFLISLVVLKTIFKDYQKGAIFSVANAQRYAQLGWIAFVDALFIKSFSHSLLVFAATFANPPGHRYITIGFGTPHLTTLFVGILLVIISWVMLEASKIHDEQLFTI